MLEFSKKEKTRSLVEKWKELEMRLADIRAEEEKNKEAGTTQKENEIGIYGGQS
jgi:hypothetical protein